jgi:hypothetical protein
VAGDAAATNDSIWNLIEAARAAGKEVVISTKADASGIPANHAFYVDKTEPNRIVLMNPWGGTSSEHKLAKSKLRDSVKNVYVLE